MADKYFVDTNILIYAHDRSIGIKHERARQIIEHLRAQHSLPTGPQVLSTQVLQEFCINLRRKVARPLPVGEIRQLLQDYLSWEIVVNAPEAVIHALEIEVKYKTSFWDALILQAAEQSGAAILYSEDLATGQNYGSVEVVNPLLA